jgi:hypothetical protein
MLAYSTDHAQTFSEPIRVSNNSPYCNGVGSSCPNNQSSQPVVAPDGTLYVTWLNTNIPRPQGENFFQILLARSSDGGNTWEPPVRVSKYYDLPHCETYTGRNPLRSCVPVKGFTQTSYFRAINYPTMAVDPANPKHIYVHYGSYINTSSNESNGCVPQGFMGSRPLYQGVTVPGSCHNDILLAESFDGGKAFTTTDADPRDVPSVNPDNTFTNHFWQWSAITPGGTLVTSYYDRSYGQDETTGFMDVTVSFSGRAVRATSSSMPPPTNFAGEFLGDYTGLDIGVRTDAHGRTELVALPVWVDTRGVGVISCPGDPRQLCEFGNQEDIFVGHIPIPSSNDSVPPFRRPRN